MWERAAVGAFAVLLLFALIVLAAKWMGRTLSRSAKQETRADVMEASLEAKEKFREGSSAARAESRSSKLDGLLKRSRRRQAP